MNGEGPVLMDRAFSRGGGPNRGLTATLNLGSDVAHPV